jgi:sugar phosphate permease
MARLLGGRVFYGWIVVGVTFATLLVSAGVRSAPGVLIHPLEVDLNWSRAAISFAVSIGLLLFGFAAPFGGMLMNRFGPRRLMLFGLLVSGGSALGSAAMTALWQFNLLWGVLSGIGTGVASAVLGATVANRWFTARRGLVLGLFGAATSAGQMIFTPALIWMVERMGWRGSVVVLGIIALIVLTPVFLLMRDNPADLGLEPYGGAAPAPAVAPAGGKGIMARAVRVPEFWLLTTSFFICGASSNGVIGVHFIPHSIDHGIPQGVAASVLAIMGGMNFVGSLLSGYLTDRYDPRKLLACYYIFRGLSLFLLPFVTQFSGLLIFAIFFGLDYIATVPPTSALTADIFGRRNVGVVFGWIFCAHQVGAALAAYGSGLIRVTFGDYTGAFLTAGALAVIGGLLALRIRRDATFEPVAPPAPVAPAVAGLAADVMP